MDEAPQPNADPLQSLLAEILESESRGKPIDRASLYEAHPNLAEDLRCFFSTHDRMKSVANVNRTGRENSDGVEEETLAPQRMQADDATLPPSPNSLDEKEQLPAVGEKIRYFGDYELIEEIARGGMGVVFKARQLNLNRIVALKMILAGQFAGEEDVQRFYTEAEAAAQLDHPGIVPIFEIGEQSGQHYFSMGYVEGVSLADRIADGPVEPRIAAQLMVEICEAIGFAHHHGVIHRDLKPANVLIDAKGKPKVTDFGLAKNTESEKDLTGTGQILGTPAYMPPEQAAGKVDQVGPLADVYSLGAILYCLLTGRPPFQAASPIDTLMQVLEKEVASPRQLNAAVSKDLETICLKCLQKAPSERYRSAVALKEELQRFLDGAPIQARPVGRLQRLRLWGRRHPWKAATAAALFLLSITLVIGGPSVALREIQMRGLVEQELYANRVQLAEREWHLAQIGPAKKALADCPPDRRGWEWNHVSRLCSLERMKMTNHSSGIAQVHVSPDGTKLLSCGFDRSVRLWDLHYGSQLRQIPNPSNLNVFSVAFHPDGKRFATAGDDTKARLWDIEGDEPLRVYAGHRRHISSVKFSPDGNEMATASGDGTIKQWDMITGELIRTIQTGTKTVHSIAYSPTGDSIASASNNGTVTLWRAGDGERIRDLFGHRRSVGCVRFSPDGEKLATASSDGAVILWDMESGELLQRFEGHSSDVLSVRFRPNGREIASASLDRTIILWNSDDGQRVRTFRGHEGAVGTLSFTPDGRWLISGSGDKSIRIWDPDRSLDVQVFEADTDAVNIAEILPGQTRLLSAASDFSAKLWHPETGQYIGAPFGHQGQIREFAFNENRKLLATAGDDNVIRIWDWETKEVKRALEGDTRRITSMQFNRDGTKLLTGSREWSATLWDIEGDSHRQLKHGADVFGVMFSADERQCFTIDESMSILVWDCQSGDRIGEHHWNRPITTFARGLGNRLWVGDQWGNIDEIDCNSFTTSTYLWETQNSPITSISLHPKGTRLAVGNKEGILTIYDVVTEQIVLSLADYSQAIKHVSFSDDGRWLVTCGEDGTVRLRDGHVPASYETMGPWMAEFAYQRTYDLDATKKKFGLFEEPAEAGNFGEFLRFTAATYLKTLEPSPDELVDQAYDDVARPGASPSVYRLAIKKAQAAEELGYEYPWVDDIIATAEYRLGNFEKAADAMDRYQAKQDTLPFPMPSPIQAILLAEQGKSDEARSALAKSWGLLMSTSWSDLPDEVRQRYEQTVIEAKTIVLGKDTVAIEDSIQQRLDRTDWRSGEVSLDELATPSSQERSATRMLLPYLMAEQLVEPVAKEFLVSTAILQELEKREIPESVRPIAIQMAENFHSDGDQLASSAFHILVDPTASDEEYLLADLQLSELISCVALVKNESYNKPLIVLLEAFSLYRQRRYAESLAKLELPGVINGRNHGYAKVFYAMCLYRLKGLESSQNAIDKVRALRNNGNPIPPDTTMGKLIAELDHLLAEK